MDNPLEKLGVAIKKARQHADMTQKELASVVHITPQHLRAIENGRQKPSYDLLYSLMHKLAIPCGEIFCHDDMEHDRNELEKVVTMLHYCDEQELAAISAALHAIMKFK